MIFSKVFFVWCLVGIVWILFKMRKEKKLKFKPVVYRDGKKKIRVDYLVRGDYKSLNIGQKAVLLVKIRKSEPGAWPT